MRLTNGQRGDLIDALTFGIEGCTLKLKTQFSTLAMRDHGKHLEPEDKWLFDELTSQRARFTVLRRRLLREEKASLKDFPPGFVKERKRV